MKDFIEICSLKKINYFFAGGAILLVFFLILNLNRNFSSRIPLVQETKERNLEKKEIISPPFSKYKNILGKRNLFKKSEESSGELPVERPANLILLGVVLLGGKSQAMLMDKQTGNTYNCYEGDNVLGFRIKEIQKNKVILQSEEKILELKL